MLLTSLDGSDEGWSCRVDEPDAESVDYSVTSHGRTLLACQVKSTYRPTSGRPLTSTEASQLLYALCSSTEADRYLLQTNRRLSPRALSLASELAAATESGVLPDALAALATHGPLAPDEARARLSRARIESDQRTSAELRRHLAASLTLVRRSRGGGVGLTSADVLLNHCLAEVFDRGSGERWEISRGEFTALLSLDDQTLALAAGEVDWARQLADAVPRLPTVERGAEEERVRTALAGGQVRRSIRTVVLTGLSGIGKTCLAARYAHLHGAAYDVVIWLNAESTSTLAAGARRALGADRVSKHADDEDVRAQLGRWLGATPLTWLLVLDSAPDAPSVQMWLPASGYGHCLITTIDATGARDLAHVDLGEMTSGEARELVAHRLGVDLHELVEPDLRAVELLAEEAGRWPLAIELLAAFLADTGRGLAVTAEVVEQLRAEVLADEAYRPSQYPRSLVAAVRLVLRKLRSLPNGEAGMRIAQRCSLLMNEAIPLGLVGSQVGFDRATQLVEEAGADLDNEHGVAALRRCSLVSREFRRPAGHPLVADTLTMNLIVAELLRTDLEADETLLVNVLHELLLRLSELAGRWLDQSRFLELDDVRSHIERLVSYASDRGITSVGGLTLMGNLASAYERDGRHRDAVALLARERFVLRAMIGQFPDVDPSLLLIKTGVGLVANMVRTDIPEHLILQMAEEVLDLLRQRLVDPRDERLSTTGAKLLSALGLLTSTTDSVEAREVEAEARRWLPVAAAFLDDAGSGQQVENLLRAGQHEAGLELASRIEADPGFGTRSRAERCFVLQSRAEAEFACHLYVDGLQTFGRLKLLEEFAPGRVNRPVVDTALQMALMAIGDLVFGGQPPWDAVASLLEAVDASDLGAAPDVDRWRCAVLRAAVESHRGNVERAVALLDESARVPEAVRGEGGPAGWSFLRTWVARRLFVESRGPSWVAIGLSRAPVLAHPAAPRILVLILDVADWDRFDLAVGDRRLAGRWHTFGTNLVIELLDALNPATTAIGTVQLELLDLPADGRDALRPHATGSLVEGVLPYVGVARGREVSVLVLLPSGFCGVELSTVDDLVSADRARHPERYLDDDGGGHSP